MTTEPDVSRLPGVRDSVDRSLQSVSPLLSGLHLPPFSPLEPLKSALF